MSAQFFTDWFFFTNYVHVCTSELSKFNPAGCVLGPTVFVSNPAGIWCTNDLTEMKNVDAVAELDLTVSDTSKLCDVQ